ncbi:hypothetical protein ACIQCF_30165 [Streptomyces sp. NPDC088353]|uniref:hypothetical protein n=1 Tax=Streptomyces sp. NPDC088353 TaxID=3365855 RepID=UPI00381E4D57
MIVPLKFSQIEGPALSTGTSAAFSTSGVVRLDINAAVTDLAGGRHAAVYFYVEQLDAGSVWRPVWGSSTLRRAATVGARLGAGAGPADGAVVGGVGRGNGVFAMSMTSQARLGWTVSGSPTSLVFNAEARLAT